jgi:hypothetical protein
MDELQGQFENQEHRESLIDADSKRPEPDLGLPDPDEGDAGISTEPTENRIMRYHNPNDANDAEDGAEDGDEDGGEDGGEDGDEDYNEDNEEDENGESNTTSDHAMDLDEKDGYHASKAPSDNVMDEDAKFDSSNGGAADDDNASNAPASSSRDIDG